MKACSTLRSNWRRPWLLLLLLLAPALSAANGGVYYRYVNEQGVKVLDDSVPPQYAQKGYEVVSLSGEVLKVVPPAADADDVARREAEQKLKQEYQRLSRRYSSLAEIESAKQRKLDSINTNVAIVRGNITGLEAQIENLMAQAADVERGGREVPESILKKLEDSRAELAAAKELLAARQEEKKVTGERFDKDQAIYIKGKELSQR